MKFAAALSCSADPSRLVTELTQGLEPLGTSPDLLVAFFTAPLLSEAKGILTDLRASIGPRTMLAVSGESVLSGSLEMEQRSAMAVLAGSLPGVEIRPFHLGMDDWQRLNDGDELRSSVGTGEQHRGQLLFGDPFTTPVDDLLSALDRSLKAPTVGGMASAARARGGNLLAIDGEFFSEGAIGVGLGGPLQLTTVVSQGCRPIGRPMVVTRAEDELVLELGRRPALEAAQEMLQSLSSEEKELLESGVLVGVVINEYKSEFARGDFLIRHLVGGVRETGALVLGDRVRAGQTIQFHVRDANTADEDLRELLRPQADPAPAGGLMFTCNGRGTRMFPEQHHDAATTQELIPGLPLAGFFAMGELGPVGGRSFIHGHTASVALFRPT